MKRQRKEADANLKTALEELQVELEKIRVSELATLREEHEGQVEKLRSAIKQGREDAKKVADSEEEARAMLEESEDMLYDLQVASEKLRKSAQRSVLRCGFGSSAPRARLRSKSVPLRRAAIRSLLLCGRTILQR